MFRLALATGFIIVLLSLRTAAIADGTFPPPSVGGECSYKEYHGLGKITSISQRPSPKNDSYEVKFLFYPDEQITEPSAQYEGKELLLLTKRGYPRLAFLEVNDIEVGKEFYCILKVITKGTCTPTIFEFPAFTE